MKKQYSYFFFENFDAEKEANNPLNPRNVDKRNLDLIISTVADNISGTIISENLEGEYGIDNMDIAKNCGVLRIEGHKVFLDTPFFAENDLPILKGYFEEKATKLTSILESHKQEIYKLAKEISNGFSPEVNLYHTVCGMCFDGLMLDELGKRNIIATHRKHMSGLDYLMVIYEKGRNISAFSDGLLCSYNRIMDEHCALESFGDAAGDRLDCYRYFRLREQGKLSEEYREIHEVMKNFGKEELLLTIKNMTLGKIINQQAVKALELFGYLSDGELCVPVYKQDCDEIVYQLERILEDSLMDEIVEVLYGVGNLRITSTMHGVSIKEIANECWHILFGSMNEKLVQSGFVAAPPYKINEGRYLQAIELF